MPGEPFAVRRKIGLERRYDRREHAADASCVQGLFASFHKKEFRLLFRPQRPYNLFVSASETIKELLNLTEAERRAIRDGLLEIANQDPDVALCNRATLEGALMVDRMEDEDARHQSG